MNGDKPAQLGNPEQEGGTTPPKVNDQNERNNRSCRKKIAEYFLVIWGWFKKFNEPMVIVTIVVGIATGALYKATRDLVNDTKESSQHQLRSYLMFENGVMQNGPSITITNAGRTPAFNVAGACRTAVREKLLHLPTFDWPQTKYDTIDVAPDKNFQLSNCTGDTINADPVRNTLYVWGLVTYTDVFTKCQFVAFISRIEDDPGRLVLKWETTNHPEQRCENEGTYKKAYWPGPDWLPDFDPNSVRKPDVR